MSDRRLLSLDRQALAKGGITSYPRTHQKRVRDKKGAPQKR